MEKERDVFAEIDALNKRIEELTLQVELNKSISNTKTKSKSPADYLYLNDDKVNEMVVYINILKNGLEKSMRYADSIDKILRSKNS